MSVNRHQAFTLVELMVTIVIISILSSLTLAGLAGARGRGRTEKTRTTIRKLHDIVAPAYESYSERSVTGPLTGSGAPSSGSGAPYDAYVNTAVTPPAFYGPRQPGGSWPGPFTTSLGVIEKSKLAKRRLLMAREMPDSWADVADNPATVMSTLPNYCRTPAVRGYAAIKSGLASPASAYDTAECLYLYVSRSGYDPYALEQFRNDEIGDKDGDGAPEFWDSWGNPIIFLRWAPGFSPYSTVQIANASTNHDPMDPQNIDASAYALIPLIASGGPDLLTGLQVPSGGWAALLTSSGTIPPSIVTGNGAVIGRPDMTNPTAYRDNITNHSFTR